MTRDFKGVWIPKEIWLDERLNALEKIIFVEIDSLCSDKRGCFASNSYLAQFCQCSETKISKAISKLIDLEYLYVVSFNGRQRELQSCLAKNARLNSKKDEADEQKVQGSIHIYNNKDNNINNNIDSVPTTKKTNTKFIPPTVEEVKAYCKERKNHIDPERFVAYYETNDWHVGRNKMKNWKSAIRLWETNDKHKQKDEPEVSYDIEAYESMSQDDIFKAIYGNG